MRSVFDPACLNVLPYKPGPLSIETDTSLYQREGSKVTQRKRKGPNWHSCVPSLSGSPGSLGSSSFSLQTQQSIYLFIFLSYILTMHLICHVNIEAAVNLSSDNTKKNLISTDLWNPSQLLIRAQNPMWERACDICQCHKVDIVCHCVLMKKQMLTFMPFSIL